MKRFYWLIMIALLSMSSVALAQKSANLPGKDAVRTVDEQAYINHVMGLDVSTTSAKGFSTLSETTSISTSWSYPTSTPSTPFGGGLGTSSNPYLISSPQQLANLAYMVNHGNSYSGKYFRMTCDLVLNTNVINSDGSLNSGSYRSWTPIGTSSYSFKGTFDGAGHYVSGIYINASSSSYQGLFGRTSDGLITNVTVADSYICGYDYVAAVVGHSDYANITYCKSTSTVLGHFDVGGINGDVCGAGGSSTSKSNSVITACANYGKVIGSNTCTGGITGFAASGTTVSYCINGGNITGGSNYAGGIVGEPACTILKCINTGTITSSSGSRGAIVSASGCSSVTGCYYLAGSCPSATCTYGSSTSASSLSSGSILSSIDPSGTYFQSGTDGYPILKGVGGVSGVSQLYLDDFTMSTSAAKTVSVKMMNSKIITGFQFDIVLPTGMSVNSVTRSSARTSYTYNVTTKTQSDGSLRVVCIPSGSSAARFTGTDGEVLQITFSSTSSGNKTITLKNQKLTTSALEELTPASKSVSVHVHGLTYSAAVSATCTTTGHSAYYYCSSCGKYYTTAAATTETTLAACTTAALGHSLSYTHTSSTHTARCSRCSYSVTSAHNYVHGVCSVCGTDGRPYVITSNTVGATVSFANSGSYGWTYDSSNNRLMSTNNGVNSSTSSTTMTIRTTTGTNFSFQYQVSSETNYDKYTIILDGTTVVNNISGSTSLATYSTTLTAGTHTLVMTYSKDGSVHSGNDHAYLSNVKITTVPVTSIVLSSTSKSIVVGKTATITATAYPTNANNRNVVWSSSDTTVARVSGGTITAVRKGTAYIYATAADGFGARSYCTVTSIERGDVNGNGYINIADVTGAVKFITGDNTTGLYFDAADYNANGSVTTTDAIAILRLALNGTTTYTGSTSLAKGSLIPDNTLAVDDIQMDRNSTRSVEVGIVDNTDKFTSMQFDVALPEGVSIENVTVGNRVVDHSVVYNDFQNGIVRVICYSLSNQDFNSMDGSVVNLNLKTSDDISDGCYDVEFRDIIFVRGDVSTVYSDGKNVQLTVGCATGIDAIASNGGMNVSYANGQLTITAETAGVASVYTTSGMLEYKNNLSAGQTITINLPAGMYVVNGKTMALKK